VSVCDIVIVLSRGRYEEGEKLTACILTLGPVSIRNIDGPFAFAMHLHIAFWYRPVTWSTDFYSILKLEVDPVPTWDSLGLLHKDAVAMEQVLAPAIELAWIRIRAGRFVTLERIDWCRVLVGFNVYEYGMLVATWQGKLAQDLVTIISDQAMDGLRHL
jgi:hypothetical protein